MLSFKRLGAVTKKEFSDLLFSPISIIFSVVFLFLSFWIFFSNIFASGQASLRLLFAWVPLLFVIFLPSLTMARWADEKKSGTLETLLTLPVRDGEVVLGKFLACLLFAASNVLGLLLAWIGISFFGAIDPGSVWGAVLGLICLSAASIAIGLFISSLTQNQIVAFITTTLFLFVFQVMGESIVLDYFPDGFQGLLSAMSLSAHFASMARGVIDSRDVLYYLSVTGFFLYLNTLSLESRRWEKQGTLRGSLAGGLLALILIFVNTLGAHHYGRFDLTEDQEYTLSPATKNIIQNLQDPIDIKLYLSRSLPPGLTLLQQGIEDLLDEYLRAVPGKVRVTRLAPEDDPQIEQEAVALGLTPLQLDVVSKDRHEAMKAYIGLGIFYGDKKEVVPAVTTLGDLEYVLTSALVKLTTEKLPRLGLITPTEQSSAPYSLLPQLLQKTFEVVSVDVASNDWDQKKLDGLLWVAPKETPASAIKNITTLLDQKVPVVVFGGTVEISQQLQATSYKTGLEDFLSQYGLSVSKEIVIDPQSTAYAAFSSGFLQYHIPYPFFLKLLSANLNRDNPITSRLESVLLPWSNALSIDASQHADWKYEVLGQTSNAAVLQEGEPRVMPEALQAPNNNEPSIKSLAVVVTTSNAQGRLAVVANSQFVSDTYLSDYPGNALFALNLIDWMARGDELIGIRSRGKTDHPLQVPDGATISFLQFVYLIGLPLLVVIKWFIVRLWRRRHWKNIQQQFQS